MRVIIVHHYPDGERQTIDGTEAEISAQLRAEFPWASEKVPYGDAKALVMVIDRAQAYTARIYP